MSQKSERAMSRSELWVPENKELTWYHRDAACELGVRALSFSEASEHGVAFEMAFGMQPSPPPPSAKVQAAARKQALYRRALRCLDTLEQAVLKCAYEEHEAATRDAPGLFARHGHAAAVVLRVSRQSKSPEAVTKAVGAVLGAQLHYEAVRRLQRDEDAREREQAKREGKDRLEAKLVRQAGKRPSAKLRAKCWYELLEAAEVMRQAAREMVG